MHAERAFIEPKLELPHDLLTELQRRGTKPRTDMRIEGFNPSLLGRLLGLFGGKRAE
ncbi:MAG TPA: hypothetical protein VLW26_11605 [Steroidobacteraceae bacterium]|jgi:hypothetical protein|nr:hypothetical protein [Steroidobacteraceae bacterium]